MPQSPFHVLLKVLQISQNRVEKLLVMLLRGDSTAFGVFIEAVAYNNQWVLTFDLLKQERDARAKEEKAARVEEEQIGPTPTEGRMMTNPFRVDENRIDECRLDECS